MGFSRKEFFTLLPKPLKDFNAVIDETGATITLGCGTIRIEVGKESERRLSDYVILPTLPVKIIFNDVEPADKARFLRKFDFSYMKGLG